MSECKAGSRCKKSRRRRQSTNHSHHFHSHHCHKHDHTSGPPICYPVSPVCPVIPVTWPPFQPFSHPSFFQSPTVPFQSHPHPINTINQQHEFATNATCASCSMDCTGITTDSAYSSTDCGPSTKNYASVSKSSTASTMSVCGDAKEKESIELGPQQLSVQNKIKHASIASQRKVSTMKASGVSTDSEDIPHVLGCSLEDRMKGIDMKVKNADDVEASIDCEEIMDSCSQNRNTDVCRSSQHDASNQIGNARLNTPEKCYYLEKWCLKSVKRVLFVEGVLTNTDSRWHSGRLMQILPPDKLITKSGSIYYLVGPPDSSLKESMDVSDEDFELFTNGLPGDWASLVLKERSDMIHVLRNLSVDTVTNHDTRDDREFQECSTPLSTPARKLGDSEITPISTTTSRSSPKRHDKKIDPVSSLDNTSDSESITHTPASGPSSFISSMKRSSRGRLLKPVLHQLTKKFCAYSYSTSGELLGVTAVSPVVIDLTDDSSDLVKDCTMSTSNNNQRIKQVVKKEPVKTESKTVTAKEPAVKNMKESLIANSEVKNKVKNGGDQRTQASKQIIVKKQRKRRNTHVCMPRSVTKTAAVKKEPGEEVTGETSHRRTSATKRRVKSFLTSDEEDEEQDTHEESAIKEKKSNALEVADSVRVEGKDLVSNEFDSSQLSSDEHRGDSQEHDESPNLGEFVRRSKRLQKSLQSNQFVCTPTKKKKKKVSFFEDSDGVDEIHSHTTNFPVCSTPRLNMCNHLRTLPFVLSSRTEQQQQRQCVRQSHSQSPNNLRDTRTGELRMFDIFDDSSEESDGVVEQHCKNFLTSLY